MPTIRQVESQIERVEGFTVRILHGRDGRDVRGDKQGIPRYRFERALKNIATVHDWRKGRFQPNYPGFEVEVLHPSGRRADGNLRLATLRDEWSESSG